MGLVRYGKFNYLGILLCVETADLLVLQYLNTVIPMQMEKRIFRYEFYYICLQTGKYYSYGCLEYLSPTTYLLTYSLQLKHPNKCI